MAILAGLGRIIPFIVLGGIVLLILSAVLSKLWRKLCDVLNEHVGTNNWARNFYTGAELWAYSALWVGGFVGLTLLIVGIILYFIAPIQLRPVVSTGIVIGSILSVISISWWAYERSIFMRYLRGVWTATEETEACEKQEFLSLYKGGDGTLVTVQDSVVKVQAICWLLLPGYLLLYTTGNPGASRFQIDSTLWDGAFICSKETLQVNISDGNEHAYYVRSSFTVGDKSFHRERPVEKMTFK